MHLLTVNDIKEWLIANEAEFLKLKRKEFPPFDNALFSMYNQFNDFIKYADFQEKCSGAIEELSLIVGKTFTELSQWVNKYELFGSRDLLMFEVNYNKWSEDLSADALKISKGIYTLRKPFASIICFCEVFQFLYWDNCIHEAIITGNQEFELIVELKEILGRYTSKNN